MDLLALKKAFPNRFKRQTAGARRRLGFESLEDRRLLHGVLAVAPFNGESNVAVDASLVVAFDFDADPATVNASTFELRDPQGSLIPAAVTYDAFSRSATLRPDQDLADLADYYEATIVGGALGVRKVDGEPMELDYTWHFITETPLYSDTIVFSGLVNPTAVEFADDGRVFVAEKSGLIKVFDDLNDPSPDLFADLRTEVHNHWDRGLLGMALHPDFPTVPELYVLYTYDAPLRDSSLPPGSQDLPPAPYWGSPGVSGDPGPGTSGNGPSVSARLSRLTVGPENTWDYVEHVLVHDWGQQFPSHSIGDLAFGSDGALYVSGGDGASFSTEDFGQDDGLLGTTALNDPPSQGGALRSQDLRSRDLGVPVTDDPVALNGTIIRVDPSVVNGGAPLPDNPLFGDPDPNAERIIAYGLRNPFRITVKPGTNEIWSGDVGYRNWEEINVIRDPTDSLIENFGWPAYEGNDPQPGYDGLNLPLLEDLYRDPIPSAHIEPFFSYEHGKPVFAGDPQPTGSSSSISGLAFSEGGNLPPAYDSALFFADFSRTGIWVMFPGIDGDPNPASGKPVLLNAQNPVQLKIGPAGDLYYVDVAGSIRRIRFEGIDVPPNALAQASRTSGPLNPDFSVSFDATGSSDQNPGDTLTYRWDLDGDGQLDDSTSPQPSFTYTAAAVVTVTLEVTDSTGLTDTDTIRISVGNTAPTAVIDSPSVGFTWKVGDTINFSGHANDVDEIGGVLPTTALEWEINLLHCPDGQCHAHLDTTFSGTGGGSIVAPDHEYPSQLEIKLTATDPITSMQNTTTILLLPQTVDFVFQSNPSGLELTINGVADTTPFTFTVISGSNNLINAPSPQTGGQTSHLFKSWSDDGAQSHNVVAGTEPQTLTATFDAPVTPFDTTDDGLGTITAQGENGTFQGKTKVFDNNLTSKWLDFANQDPSTRASWIEYQYADNQQYVVTSYTITSGNDAPARDPRDWTLSGSNDGINFIPLDSRADEFFSARTETRPFAFANSTPYNIYRLDIHSVANPAGANSMQIGEIELMGVPAGAVGTPTIALFAEDADAAEGLPVDGGRFTFVRGGDLSDSLDVSYAINGSASSNDYLETLTGTVSFPASSASVTIDITPIDDPDDEGNESLVLTLLSGQGYLVGTPSSGTITISDNDAPVTPFDTTDDGLGTITAQGENGTFQGKTKVFDNNLTSKWLDFANQDPSTRASWIEYQYADNQQYVVTSYTITSGNDAPARDPRDWTLSGSNDGINFIPLDSRADEFFSARTETRPFAFANSTPYNIYRLDIHSVANPAGANSMQIGEIELMGVPAGAVGTPTIALFAEDADAAEGLPVDGGRFTFVRGGDLSDSLDVSYAINGSASSNDYLETLTGTVSFPASSASVTIDITPIDDPDDEGNESLVLTLLSGQGYLVGTPSSGTITISDNDAPVTPFDTTDDGLGTITAQGENGTFQGKTKVFDNNLTSKWLDFANQDPSTRASWIEYQYADNQQYVVTSYTITSGNDAPARDPRDWTLSGSNDGINFIPLDSRADEFFSARTETRPFAFANSTPYNIYRLDIHSVANPAGANSMQIGEIELMGVPAGAVGTPTIALFAEDADAAEGLPVDGGRFTFVRGGDLSDSLDVSYAINGSASSNDYLETLTGTVSFPASSASVTIDITPIDDPDDEGNESLVLTLLSGQGYLVGTPSSGTITISDNDAPVTPFDTTDDGLGTITAQGENGTFQGKTKVFDNNLTSKWLDFANQDPSTRASWIEYQYADNQQYVVTSYTITSGNDAPARDPRDWTLSGSNDGINFIPLDSRADEFFSARTETRPFAFANSTPYNIYRLDIHSVANPAGANSMQIGEIELMGVPAGAVTIVAASDALVILDASFGAPATPEVASSTPLQSGYGQTLDSELVDAVLTEGQDESIINVVSEIIQNLGVQSNSGGLITGYSSLDVNRDNRVSALDALLIINRLTLQLELALNSLETVTAELLPDIPFSDYDVNEDGKLTALDAVIVINSLF